MNKPINEDANTLPREVIAVISEVEFKIQISSNFDFYPLNDQLEEAFVDLENIASSMFTSISYLLIIFHSFLKNSP